jgi:aspartate aminotransferase
MAIPMKLNPTIQDIKPSATLAINEHVKILRKKGNNVVHFGFGESPFPVPPALKEALIQHADKKTYLPGEGLPTLRETLCAFYQKVYHYTFQPNHVIVTPGSKEALFHLLYLLDGPLLLPSPSWVSYGPQARLLQKPVYYMPTQREHNYCLEASTLAEQCKAFSPDQQKILIINSPNNPTGCSIKQNNLDELAQVCRDNNIVVVSDEIYAGTQGPDHPHTSMVYSYPEKTIVTSGLSKVFSAGGYRLGFCLIPSALAPLSAALTTLISETFSCVSAPIQYAAIEAYRYHKETQSYVEKCSELHRMAGLYLYEQLTALQLHCPKPDGAFYLMPDFSHYRALLLQNNIRTDTELCAALLHQQNLAVLPGSDFGMAPLALSVRVASVDYDGQAALTAYTKNKDINLNAVMPKIREGCNRLNRFLSTLHCRSTPGAVCKA